MTDVWGANTFPVRKYNSRTFHLKVRRSRLFRFFRRFPQINVGGDSARIPFVEHASRESRVALPPKGRLRQLATPLGTVFRELGHLILCNVLSWLSPLLVSLYLSYVLVYINYLLLLVRFKCMREVNIYSFDAHKHQHYLHTWLKAAISCDERVGC